MTYRERHPRVCIQNGNESYCGKPLGSRFVTLDDEFNPQDSVCGGCLAGALKYVPKKKEPEPVPMRLHCPECHRLHVDEGVWATKVHHTHSCQYCGMTWRPAVVATVGVQFLPGFKND